MEEIQWYKYLFWFGLTTGRMLFQVVFLPQCNVPEVFILLIIIRSFIYYLLHSIFVSRCCSSLMLMSDNGYHVLVVQN